YPPWQAGPGGPAGPYAPIYEPPPSVAGQPPMQIDFSRLLLQWAMIGLVAGGMVTTGKESAAGQSPGGSPRLQTIPPTIEASAVALPMRKMKFPEKRKLGELLLENADDPEYWDFVAVAQGTVEVPEDCRLQLELEKDQHVDLSCLVRAE